MNIDQEDKEGCEAEEADNPPFVYEIFNLKTDEAKINDRDREEEEKIIEKGGIRNPMGDKARLSPKPIDQKKGRPQKGQKEEGRKNLVTCETEDG